jgi:ketosteroid isomerase-like protein
MKQFFFLLSASAIFLTACNNDNKTENSQPSANTEDHSSEVAAIMKADSAWDKMSEAKSAEGWLSYYSDDAIMMPPGENVCKDKTSRETSIKNMFAVPGISLRFQTTKAEVSKSGDIGYAVGVYQWNSKDPKGKDYHETGKYTEVWKKQADGNWKCTADIWNADPQPK